MTYNFQSSSVTIPKAMPKSALGALQTWKRASVFFIMLLIWLNTSSRGFRSGEYGGKNNNRAPTWSSINCRAPSTWWIEASSMITTDSGFTQLNGLQDRHQMIIKYFPMHLQNLLLNRYHGFPELTWQELPSIGFLELKVGDLLVWFPWENMLVCAYCVDTHSHQSILTWKDHILTLLPYNELFVHHFAVMQHVSWPAHVLQDLVECSDTNIDSKSGYPLLLNFMEVCSRVVDDQYISCSFK